ncbi:MAG: exodeoxyribonuclease V subunit gamma [Syntrophales bacterium]|nr:exodeoxyribonuclease V subunit gamma [Syntrophales bacterium]
MALFGYISNRLELLADELAQVITREPLDPLQGEIVIVQSHGMDRWLTYALAKRIGIIANVKFPFPSHFLKEVMSRLSAIEEESWAEWEPEVLTWNILKLLPSLLEDGSFRPIKNYVGGEDDHLKAFELAGQIATTFDHYLVFRPDMVTKWEGGEEHHWQAVLWREIIKKKRKHPAYLLDRLVEESLPLTTWPQRVSLFGISYLPPLYLDLFLTLSSYFDVHFFLLNPCQEYWGDALSPKELSRQANKAQELFFSSHNNLLSSLGRRGREFFDLWIEKTSQLPYEEKSIFEEPGEDTLLHIIQSDILHFRDRGDSKKKVVDMMDDSIQIHSCHGPLREIEILQDYLLEFLRRDETLKPSDILIMTPDIDTYAPYIKAVFSLPEEDPRNLPFSIADSVGALTGPLTKTFFKMGKLKESRLEASSVLDILSSPAVRRKFGLTEEEWETTVEWVHRSGIYWGWDAKTRAELNLPAMETGTWKAGIRRMLLGYALPLEEDNYEFSHIVPFDEIEGSDRNILEGFLKFLNALDEFLATLKEQKNPKNWASFLRDVTENFFLPDVDEELAEISRLLQAIDYLEITAENADFATPIPAEVAYEFVERQLSLSVGASGFMTGGITFCHMVPMRSIPFRVICLVGMNFGSFPRYHRAPSFDLIVKYPRPGDPSKRYDDRFLFLEAILSARDILYISYTGRSPEDNSQLPPSVVVSEFLDFLNENFVFPREIVTQHRLQAFSPFYFRTDSPLFSYSQENMEGAKAFSEPQKVVPIFFDTPLPPPKEDEFAPTVDNLCRFFSHPCRFFIHQRLGINLSEEELILTDEEPFLLDALQRYQLKERLLEEKGNVYLKCLMEGKLPYGNPGVYVFHSVQQEIWPLREKKSTYVSGFARTIQVEVVIEGERKTWQIKGTVKDIFPEGYVFLRPTKSYGRALLVAWVTHLILSCSRSVPHDFRTFVLLTEKDYCFKPPENPAAQLEKLLNLYDEGLCRPLKLFPEVSRIYVEHLMRKGDKEKALQEARTVWEGGYITSAEQEDPYHALCFKGKDPLDEEFAETALMVFEPIYHHLEVIK